MELESKVIGSVKKTSDEKSIRKDKNAHLVFITGESGITEAFKLIKSKLTSDPESCLTLIYYTSAYLSQPLFKAELENLEKRFPSKLITHYLFCRNQERSESFESHQQILEIVINSNTCNTIQFTIQGSEEMIHTICDRLQFLGIKSNHIHSQII
jgi:ferredoxin-NADP reductase